MAEQTNKNRVVWLDLLRVVATCMVPMAHLCSNCWNITDGVTSADYITLNFFGAAYRWAVPAFVMISGVFFLNPDKPCDPQKIFKKNVLKMAKVFIFWSIVYAVQWTFFRPIKQGEVVEPFTKKAFVSELIIGEYHMWYLYMIALLYLLTPLIRVFTDNATKKQLEAFMGLSFVFVNLIPMIITFPFFRQFPFADIYEDLHIGFIGGYLGVYIAGQYLVKYPLEKQKRRILYVLGILSYLFTAVGNLFLSIKTDKSTKALLETEYANATLIAVAVFVFFLYVVSKVNFKEKTVKFISWLSKYSFGVYLCHVLVMRAFQYFGIQVIHLSPQHATFDLSFLPYVDIPPIIGVPVLSAVVIVLSFGLSWLLSKIPFFNKHFI